MSTSHFAKQRRQSASDVECSDLGVTVDLSGQQTSGQGTESEHHGSCEVTFKTGNSNNLCWDGFSRFSNETNIHGVKYIFHSSGLFARIVWLLLVLLSVGVLTWQITDRVLYFYDYPVTVNIEIEEKKDGMPFPAVTICNTNSFRLVETESRGFYGPIKDYYSGVDKKKLGDMDSMTILTSLAHRKNDSIKEAFFQSESLTLDDFQTVFTDYGVCYSFNVDNKERLAMGTGVAFGLVMLLNLEQYEYMEGEHKAAGLRVLVHNKDETPRMKDLSISVPASTSAMIGVSTKIISNLEQPYGPCKKNVTSGVTCLHQCSTAEVSKLCKCKPYYAYWMTDWPATSYCNVTAFYDCFLKKLDKFRREPNNCTDSCPPPCEELTYQPSISYTALSAYLARGMADNAAEDAFLANNYAKAREILHRVDSKMVQSDYKQVLIFKKNLKQIDKDFNELYSYASKKSHSVADMSKPIDANMNSITEGLVNARDNYAKVSSTDHLSPMVLTPLANFRYTVENDLRRSMEVIENLLYGDCNNYTLHKQNSSYYGVGDVTCDANLTDPNRTTISDSPGKVLNLEELRYLLDILSDFKQTKLKLTSARKLYSEAITRIDNEKDKETAEFPAKDAVKIKDKLVAKENEFQVSSERLIRSCQTFIDYIMAFTKDRPSFTEWVYVTHNFTGHFPFYIKQAEDNSMALSRVLKSITVSTDSLIFYTKAHQVSLKDGYDKVASSLGEIVEGVSKILDAKNNRFQPIHAKLDTLTQGNMVASMTQLNSLMPNITQSFTQTNEEIEFFINSVLPILSADSADYARVSSSAVTHLTKVEDLYEKVVSIGPKCKASMTLLRNNSDIMIFTNRIRKKLEESRKMMVNGYTSLSAYMDNFNSSININENFIKDNYVYLNVFYTTFNLEKITKSRAYLWFALICDIGGSAGLYLGASLLAIIEICYFLTTETYTCIQRHNQTGVKSQHYNDNGVFETEMTHNPNSEILNTKKKKMAFT